MYCSSCREAMARGLNYCNGCGAKLSDAKENAVARQPDLFPDSLVWAIVSVFILGLGIIIGLMAMMKQALNFSNEWILGIASISFLLLVAIESVLIWLLITRTRAANAERDAELATANVPRELPAADPSGFGEPVSSITDKTTRKFDPVYREKSRTP